MGLFDRKKKDKAAPEAAPEAISEAAETAAAADDSELIAVIAAAVAAYEAEQYRQIFYIQKLNRASGQRPVWGAMGTQESIDTRRM